MMLEWLTERCLSTDPREIRLLEMASLDLCEDNRQKLLDRSEQFQRWIDTKWNPFIADMLPGDELWDFVARTALGPIWRAALDMQSSVMERLCVHWSLC
jgi:hypothetical protein